MYGSVLAFGADDYAAAQQYGPARVLEGAVGGDRVHEREPVLLSRGIVVGAECRGHVHQSGSLFRRDEGAGHDESPLALLWQRYDLERPQVFLPHQLAPAVAGDPFRRGQRLAAHVHVRRAIGGHDVAHPVHLVLPVLEVRVHRDRDVGQQRPWGGGPDHQLPVGIVRERERDEHRVRLDFLVAERELMRRQGRTAARAVRQHLVAPVQQRLVVQPLEQPPHRLDVIVGVGDVGVLVIQPVSDSLRQRLPIGLVLEDILAAQPVEFLDAVRFDLLLARDGEHALDFDLDGKAVRVPPGDARDALPQHRMVAAHQILDGAREYVMDARASVGRGRPLVKHERRSVPGGLLRLLEQALVLPRPEQLLLQRVGRELGVEKRVRHQLRRSSTPPTRAVSAGSAARATAMICSTEVGASASGRH